MMVVAVGPWPAVSTCTSRPLPAQQQQQVIVENLALVDAMDNLKDFVFLFDGSTYKQQHSLLGTALFAERFERVFDKSLSEMHNSNGRNAKLSESFHKTSKNNNNNNKYSGQRARRLGNNNSNDIINISNNNHVDYVELSYKESFQEYLTLFHAGTRAEILEFKAIFKGMVEYTIQAILEEDQECVVFRSTAMVNPRNGKLVLVERQETIMTPLSQVVSGQIPARPNVRVACNFPSESQLAQHVLPLAWGNMLLCEGTDLLPTEQVGTVIKLRLVVRPPTPATTTTTTAPSSSSSGSSTSADANNAGNHNHISKRLRLPLLRRHNTNVTSTSSSATRTTTGTAKNNHQARTRIDIQKTVDGSPYAGGVWLEEFKNDRSSSQYYQEGGFLLRDKHDIPIALCLQERAAGQQRARGPVALARALRPSQQQQRVAYNIMGRNPMYEHDRPSTSQFYPWYRVETSCSNGNSNSNGNNNNGNNVNKTCTILIWNGSCYEPLMTTKQPPLASSYWTSDDEMDHQYSTRILFSSSVEEDVFLHHCRSLQPKFSYGYMTRGKQEDQANSTSSRSSFGNNNNGTACAPTENEVCNLTIAPGTDPALMICLAAVTEELIGY